MSRLAWRGVAIASWVAVMGACQAPPSPVDGGAAPSVDVASQRSDAGLSVDPDAVAGVDVDTVEVGDEVPVDPRAELLATIAALEGLLEGRLPTDLDPQTLFDVDLLDEEARSRRIEELRSGLAGPEPSLDAGVELDGAPFDVLDADFAGALEADALEAVPEAGAFEEDAGVPGAAFDLPGSPEVDAGWEVADAGPSSVAEEPGPEDELESLRSVRDRLRLRFLTLPEAERRAVIEAVRTRRRIAIEEQASRADAVRASADAQRASEARDDLLSRAASADAIESALLAEHARMEAVRGELARWQLRFARQRETEAREGARRLQRIHRLELTVDGLSSRDADHEYDAVVDELQNERRQLDDALDGLTAPSPVPGFELGVDLDVRPYRDLPEAQELREAVARFDEDRAQAMAAEERFRWDWLEHFADDLRRLDQLRVRLLRRMSRDRRETVLGLGAEGRAQAARELGQIRLMGRYWVRRSWHRLPSLPAALGSLLSRSSTRIEVTWVFVLGVLLLTGWRQRERITDWLRRVVHDRTGAGRRWRGIARPLFPILGPLVVPLAAVAGLHVLFGLLDGLSDSLLVDVLRVIVVRIAWFFVAVTAVARFFVSRLRHGASRAPVARRIFGSVRLVMGFLLVVVLMTDLSELLVGHGYLYGLVVDVAWLGVLPIALVLVHQWNEEVCAAHREKNPEGYVARRLEPKDTAIRRWLLTPFAAVQLGVLGVYAAVKELALRFDQLRSAFAFLFRRRLERLESGAIDEAAVERLPADVRRAFAEVPTDRDLEIDFFPELDPLALRAREFLDEGAPGFAVALVGERGIGKTTWLKELARRTEGRAQLLDVPHRLVEAGDVCAWLAVALGVSETRSVEELSESLESVDAPRIVLLDHCQNLVVRAIGGTIGLETLVEIAARTSRHVVWVCSFSRYTWLYLERARQGQDLFREHVSLGPWSEERIAQLIHRRMKVLGREASFRDLVVDRVAGSALADAVLRTEGEYLRLLWDFAQGNPRVAIHFWKHSLQAEGDELKVRLFAAPDADDLDPLHEQSRFLLATIALHENATVGEAAASAGSSLRECSALLAYLESCGYVRSDAEGHWRLSTHWYRGVIRHLRRQRLLFD